jgi:hypothetical protein
VAVTYAADVAFGTIAVAASWVAVLLALIITVFMAASLRGAHSADWAAARVAPARMEARMEAKVRC